MLYGRKSGASEHTALVSRDGPLRQACEVIACKMILELLGVRQSKRPAHKVLSITTQRSAG